jgi:hypothetical protein
MTTTRTRTRTDERGTCLSWRTLTGRASKPRSCAKGARRAASNARRRQIGWVCVARSASRSSNAARSTPQLHAGGVHHARKSLDRAVTEEGHGVTETQHGTPLHHCHNVVHTLRPRSPQVPIRDRPAVYERREARLARFAPRQAANGTLPVVGTRSGIRLFRESDVERFAREHDRLRR